jgi:hypothetical protein
MGAGVSALALTSRAYAESPGLASTPAEPAGYAEAISGAIDEYQAGHFAEARALFMRAHALLPNARTMRGLGMVEFELRNYASSMHWLEQALACKVRPLDPALNAQTEQLLARARGFVGRFELRLRPSDARVLVDGAVAELGPDRVLELDVGDHLLEVRAPERASDRRTLHVNGGEWTALEISLPEQARLTGEPSRSGRTEPARDQASEGGSLLASPWFWVAVGAVAVGGVTAGVLLSQGETREAKPYGGDTGAVLTGP